MGAHVRRLVATLAVATAVPLACSPAGSASSACDPASTRPCVSVLFIGNSYTYENDLPGTFAALAGSGGRDVAVGSNASGGWTLAEHAADRGTVEAIRSAHWTYVVLQEQSQMPASAASLDASTAPAARSLATQIRERGSKLLLFETWAHRDGWPERGLDRGAMQAALASGYAALGRELDAPVVRVGDAWARVADRVDLWQGDGTHPTSAGTYLAACVFYRAVFGASPVGIAYDGGLGRDTARLLQEAAAAT